ncbi:acyl-CoA dehydrogenase family protein [Croceicoccus sediminis]|uniref:acyl-CoA dehydrogenase family protein n=1 Tax=Croceicoccus sediminis TaxID=2571150 RepID=UPI0011822BD9|nr:acyl-CoA dehydrogenase family protein [Croceicoccus sediminis]
MLADFRAEVRAFVDERLPATTREKVLAGRPLDKHEHVEWHKILNERGWYTGHWPKSVGGLGWSPMQRWIFENEIYYRGSPWLIPFGVTFAAPIIYTFGNDDQKARFLPAIKSGDAWWAQGYSETGAGSDLANVSTRGVRDGSDWIISGSKIWTTTAHWADMIFAIVRTRASDKPQAGLSFILIDMASPGVSVEPIVSIDGHHHLNQVFFDEVRVPDANLVGEEGKGWGYAKFLLEQERILAAEVGRCALDLDKVKALIAQPRGIRPPLGEQGIWSRRVAELEVRLTALESTALHMLSKEQSGEEIGVMASMLKLVGSELSQEIDAASLDAINDLGLSADHFGDSSAVSPWARPDRFRDGVIGQYLYGRAATIYGGSSEVQRNILSKTVLDR